MTKKIFIAGSGGIGEAAALLLREWCKFEIEIFLGDIAEENLLKAREFVLRGSSRNSKVETVLMGTGEINDPMKSAFEKCDVLLDCSRGDKHPRSPNSQKTLRCTTLI